MRRIFEAEKHPKGSPERIRLNANALTSEYMHSYRYGIIVTPMTTICYRSKSEAVCALESRAKSMALRNAGL